MTESNDKEQYCSETSLRLKLSSGPSWAIFLSLVIRECPSSDAQRPHGYLPKEWRLSVIKPGYGPRFSMYLRDLYESEDTSTLSPILFDSLSSLRSEALGEPLVWNDKEELFLASSAEQQHFLLHMPFGPSMVAILQEGQGGGMYEVVEPANWGKIIPKAVATQLVTLKDRVRRANARCHKFWESLPRLSERQYYKGGNEPRNLSLVLAKSKSAELVFRPVMADPTTSHDPAAQFWIAKEWRLGWRSIDSGLQELMPTNTFEVPERLCSLVSMLEAASERHGRRTEEHYYHIMTLFEVQSPF